MPRHPTVSGSALRPAAAAALTVGTRGPLIGRAALVPHRAAVAVRVPRAAVKEAESIGLSESGWDRDAGGPL